MYKTKPGIDRLSGSICPRGGKAMAQAMVLHQGLAIGGRGG